MTRGARVILRIGESSLRRRLLLLLGAVLATIVLTMRLARAADENDALFQSAVAALRDGRASDAIASFESLADRGVVDAVASYDRGLAYAMRARLGAEVPGDLGRAAHGFEEARNLSRDSKLDDDAARALGIVRSEIARRRLRAGEPVEIDPGRSLSRSLAGLLPEQTWSVLAAMFSAILTAGFFARWLARDARWRIAGGVVALVAGPVLLVAVGMTLAARHDRLTLKEAVVVSTAARPSDPSGVTLPGASPLPEGARVETLDSRGAMTRVRFGSVDAWVSSNTLRELSRPD